MPDAGRMVRSSLGMLRRLGYGDREARQVIDSVCARVLAGMPDRASPAAAWVQQIRELARKDG